MANAASTIEIELEIRDAINRLGKLEGELKKSSSAMDRVANSTNKMESAFKSARNAASALVAAISVQQIAQAADTFTRFSNQIRIATNSAAEAAAVQKELYQVSQATGTAIEDTTKLYSRLRIAADQLGSSQAETIRITEIVAKSLAAAGTSSTEASGALLQLAQALNSPKVQAEEFNSLIDGMPNLLREVEKQLGLTAGSLKKFVTDGNLTNQLFKNAILGSADAINQQFDAAQDTIATSLTRLNNAFILLVGNFEEKTGFFNSIASVISTLAENMDELARVLKAVAVGFTIAFAPKVIRAIRDTAAAMTVLGAATKTNVIGALAALGFYIADVTGGIDLLMEKLGLTKDKADEAAGAIVDLTKVGGGGGANLEAATPKMPSLYFQTYVEGLAAMMNSNASKTEVKKQIMAFMDYFNQTVEQAVEEGGFSFTPYPDFDPTFKEIIPVKDFIENEYIPILQMLEGMLAQAPNLTFFEEIREELLEQIRLFTVLEENAQLTTDAIVSGVSGAGPNASRAANIAQSKSIEEAAAKLILSNEKVAKVIDESFEILFEILDPILDVLGDLLSAINRLIGALLENATNAAEGILDTVGLGPNGYIFGGGLARDLEAAFSSSRPGGPTNQQKAFAQADSIFEGIADAPSTRDQLQPTIDSLADLIPDLGLTEVVNRIKQNTKSAVSSLTDVLNVQFQSLAAAPYYLMNQIGKEIKKTQNKIAETEEKSKIVIQGLIEAYIQEPLNALDNLTQSAQDQIDAINFQNLSIEEQIEFRYQEAISTIEQQRALADLIDDEALRTQLLNAVNRAEAKTIELKNKQLAQLEREQQLLQLQNVESGLQALLSDFERTIEKINELVQSLFDQANELLFSDFNTQGPQEQFALAQETYGSLLENAFDADATEDDIKALQAFVNEYLTAARNVFKSSTAYTDIFEAVLGDLTGLGLQTGFNAPIQASSDLSGDLEEILGVLDENFVEVVNELIANINAASLAFAQQQIEFLTEVTEIPLELSGNEIVIDTSGLSKTVELTSENFSLDSTSLDLSLAMSTSMFTIDTSNLNFGTITPSASAGTPHLGTITPTVSLNTSSVTNSFNSLSSAINSAIQSFSESLAEAAIYARLGFDYEAGPKFFGISGRRVAAAYTSFTDVAEMTRFGQTSISEQVAEYNRVFGSPGSTFKYAVSYNNDGGMGVIQFYENLSDATIAYDSKTREDLLPYVTDTNVQKYGFRRGGLVDPMDTIPAMLSPGEYILSPETVRRYGVSNLNRLNSGDSAAINATSDPEVKRLLAELIVAVRENDTEVNVYTDMQGQTKASIEEFRSELRERTRRQGDQYVPARYI